MKTINVFLAVVLGAACVSSYAASAKQQLSQQDKMWITQAHQINLAEIKLGEMAQRKGHANAVREAGQTLESDHERLDSKLEPVAENLGISLPESPTLTQQAEAEMLSDKSGMAFDQAWVQTEISAHEKAITKTNKEISKGSSPKVQSLAKETLPVLEKHLHMLRRTSDKLYGGG